MSELTRYAGTIGFDAEDCEHYVSWVKDAEGLFCKYGEANGYIAMLENVRDGLKKQIDELKDENQRLMRLVDGTKEELRLQGERDQQEAEDAWDD